MDVASERELERELEHAGLSLITCSASSLNPQVTSKRIKRRDIIEMMIPWLAMIKAGVPLIESIQDSLEEIENKDLREIARQIAAELEQGANLEEVASRYPKVFDEMSQGILRSGMESGRLDSSFDFLIRHHGWVDSLRKNVTQMMIEPGILLVVIIAFIIGMFTFIVPQLMKVIALFNVPMPLPTKIMFAANEFFSAYGIYVLILLTIILLAIPFFYLRSHSFRFWFDGMKLRMPVFGHLNKMIAASRFSHNLSAMFRAGVNIVDGLEITAKAVGNSVVEKQTLAARDGVIAGRTLTESMLETTVFSPMVLRMVKAGEESGKLDDTLEYVCVYYDEEVPRRIAKVLALMTPAVTIILGAVVLLVALSIFLPMLNLIDAVHMHGR